MIIPLYRNKDDAAREIIGSIRVFDKELQQALEDTQIVFDTQKQRAYVTTIPKAESKPEETDEALK